MSNKITIGKLINMDVTTAMLPEKTYKSTKDAVATPETIIGIELEIESLHHVKRNQLGFEYHDDGSLRNHGGEFVTYPMKCKYVQPLLNDFFTLNKITAANYSERCSTHVHVNVQDHTTDQLAGLVLLYQVFERLLFKFVDPDRVNNIFCVPWFQANTNINLVEYIEKQEWRTLQRWQKYTALNLAPVAGDNGHTTRGKGTVEYRHLQGTCDVSLIMNWINLITSMHSFAKENSLDEIKKAVISLNSTSAYEMFLQAVFKEWHGLLMIEDYRLAMEDGVIDAKLMLMKEEAVAIPEDPWATLLANRNRPMAPARMDIARGVPAPRRFGAVYADPYGNAVQDPAEVVINNLQDDFNNEGRIL